MAHTFIIYFSLFFFTDLSVSGLDETLLFCGQLVFHLFAFAHFNRLESEVGLTGIIFD